MERGPKATKDRRAGGEHRANVQPGRDWEVLHQLDRFCAGSAGNA